MTVSFPPAPRIMKGVIVSLDADNPLASVIVFQYNPETVTRRVDARTVEVEVGGDRSEVLRLSGPPRETITMTIEVDAADQLEQGDPRATSLGVYPALSALELLLYPRVKTILDNLARARAGDIEIIPPEAPLTVLVFGTRRVVPVRMTSFSITEEAHDPALNPIRARVELSLAVLSAADLPPEHPGFEIYIAHQIAKEAMGTGASLSRSQALIPTTFISR
jgi:hypothetical protein